MKCYLNVVSIQKILFSEYIKKIHITTINGILNIYPGHTALLTTTIPGALYILTKFNKKKYIYISSGILEVQPMFIQVVVKKAIFAEHLNYDTLMKKKNSINMLMKDSQLNKKKELYHSLKKINAKLYTINIMKQCV
ncbi:ATP synthase F1 subunit epsilon [Buchnera aphidicola]|uniref:ATP synthase F1 subunit epsilon n=1 Tax=Buchnera aphidicola TaxID=9 RepID=UPI003463889A